MRRSSPARGIEARENQLIEKAVALAEKQLEDGSASSQVITHYLKLGTTRERLEKEKLIEENRLLRAKTSSIESDRDNREFYEQVMSAIKRYSGGFYSEDPEDEEY